MGTGDAEDGFVSIFNGKDLSGWEGATSIYGVNPSEPGVLQCLPGAPMLSGGRRPNLVTTKEYGDFVLRFEFKMTRNGNNGLGIRMTDIYKDAAYDAMCELQLLDDGGDAYYDAATKVDKLKPYQYTGSVYGVFPSRRDNGAAGFSGGGSYVREPGEWNEAEVTVVGSTIQVRLNGQLITCGDVAKFRGDGDTPDGQAHPGLHNRRGRIGWLGHGDNVKWRNIRIKELDRALPRGRVLNLNERPGVVTEALQRAIDEASAAGGGTVVVPAGRYVTGSVLLKDNVTLLLSEGAELLASTNRADYFSYLTLMPADFDLAKEYPGARSDAVISNLHAVVGAFGATNIAVEGRGTINGQGALVRKFRTQTGDARWRNLLFYRCRGIRVEDVTLKDSAFWTFYLKESEDVVVRGVTIDAQAHWNNDGIDIDAKNVLIENCSIDAVDDAICPKSDCPNFLPENIEVRNCRLASNCNFIKFGTSCRAGFRNCRIHDCVLVPCWKSDLHHHNEPHWRPNGTFGPFPGVTNAISGLSGVAIESPDGGRISDIHVWNIDMTAACVQTPVFIRLQNRAPRVGEGEATIENVLIENVKCRAVSQIASSITGVPGLRVKGVTLRNIEIEARGGGTLEASSQPVPEKEKTYPDPTMFDMQILPAYGFYLRHADGIRFENVKLTYGPEGEERPAVVQDDCTDVTFADCSFREPAPLTRVADKDGVEWYDGVEMGQKGLLEGKPYWNTEDFYDRLPLSFSNRVSSGVWFHSKSPSGECFRFKTTSRKIRFRVSSTGKDGIDVYLFQNGAWRPQGDTTEFEIEPGTPVMIYLPICGRLKSFRMGLDRGAKLTGLPPRASGLNEGIAFYGASITQGACESRPGMAYNAIVCRRLDAPLVNLGFSDAAKMEMEMIDVLSGVWADCFVLDCIANMSLEEMKDRYERFVRRLRWARPTTPIVLAEQADDSQCGRSDEKNAVARATYEKLVSEGVKTLVYLPADEMKCRADAFEKAVREALQRK